MTELNIKLVNIHHKVPYDVYIGRPGKGLPDNKWKNTHVAKSRSAEDITKAVADHKQDLWNQICSSQVTVEELLALNGKVLACYCADRDGVTRKPCHGTNIISLVNFILAQGFKTQADFLKWLSVRRKLK